MTKEKYIKENIKRIEKLKKMRENGKILIPLKKNQKENKWKV